MQPLLRAPAQRIAGVAVFGVMSGVGFLPLFGGPGYEQSLASGLVLPTAAAITVAVELSRLESPPAPLTAVGRGVATGLWLGAVSFATALLQGARVGICDLWGGLVGFVLTALVGAVLGGVWGAVLAEAVRRVSRRRLRIVCAVLGGLALPLASALVSVWRFYSSPMVFAFDPFAGYFSGVLYDTVIDAGSQLFTYRLGSAASLVCVALVASLLTRDPDRGRLTLSPRRTVPAFFTRVVLALLALVSSVVITWNGPALGHWETSASITEELGGQLSGARCDVVFPASLLPHESLLLMKDCDEQLLAVEAALGAHGPERIVAFFFRDAGDKKRLMGAADTLIAKPWRHEIYVQLASYPHPVLGHELAHVVAGTFGRGPFRVAGGLGGLLPDPGLIEGVAVAASPEDDELSNAEWAHAMLDLGLLPPLRDVFSLDFLGASASKSYTIAGAFVRHVLDQYGGAVVRRWYGGESIETLTGKTWADLDREFRAAISAMSLLPEAASFARARFDRPAMFGRTCPHTVDALRRKADSCRDAHEVTRAVAAYRSVLAHDAHDWGARYGLGVVNVRFGDVPYGETLLRALEGEEQAPRPYRDRAADALADLALLRGDDARARTEYERLAAHTLDEDFARTLDVKALTSTDPESRAAVVALLLGGAQRPADAVLAAEREGEWEARTGSPLASYLLGRSLVGRAWYVEAAGHLDRALDAQDIGSVRVAREVVRQRAIAACALGDREAVSRMRARVMVEDGPFHAAAGRRQSTLRLLDRCSVNRPR